MPASRVWLDWSKPCISAAAAWLIDHHSVAESRIGDLQRLICVLPGRRAGRLLLAQLVHQCLQRGIELVPPRVVTPGSLAEVIRDEPVAVASSIECGLAWMAALRQVDARKIAALLPQKPDEDAIFAWHELAKMIARLHEELAGAMRTFADVADLAERLEMFGEADRWRALQNVHSEYQRTLSRCNLTDPYESACSTEVRGQKSEVRSLISDIRPLTSELVLIGVVELNAMQRTIVAAFAAAGKATTLIHAPQDASLADRFDDVGCVIPQAWQDAPISLDDRQIKIADRPDEQARCALRAIADLEGTLNAAQITIGLGEDALATTVQHAAECGGVSVRSATGDALDRSAPCRALKLIADWLDDPRFATLAQMMRHADIESHVWRIGSSAAKADGGVGVSDWLSLLDEYFAQHLNQRCDGAWLGNDEDAQRLATAHDAVMKLVAPLAKSGRKGGERRPLHEWAGPILAVISDLYQELDAGATDPVSRAALEACMAVRDALEEFAGAPRPLQPFVSAAQAVHLVLAQIAAQTLTQELGPDHIEMLGWLELHLDLAPALIIVGVNEGQIPKSVSADPFLPDSLRSALKMACNDSRYARDAYLLEAIRNSRANLTIIAGRHGGGAQGEPLTPSRLLIACDEETLVRRIALMCDDRHSGSSSRPSQFSRLAEPSCQAPSRFQIPPLPSHLLVRPQYMRITDFRAYVACPYRYALSRLLKLESLDDSATELDARQFGDLAHHVLCAFGSDGDINCSIQAEAIEKFLLAALKREAANRYGKSPMPAVQVQLARLQQRLRSFAAKQAELCQQGWRIQHCELVFNQQSNIAALDIPGDHVGGGGPMALRGKIDRIDFNPNTRTWRIIDYKTGESAKSPHETHHRSTKPPNDDEIEWCDLQLPLYQYLANAAGVISAGDTIELAYICLPKQSDGTCVQLAQWSAPHLHHAFETARDVVRNIRAGRFDANLDFDPSFDDFPRICQTKVFGSRQAVTEYELEELEA